MVKKNIKNSRIKFYAFFLAVVLIFAFAIWLQWNNNQSSPIPLGDTQKLSALTSNASDESVDSSNTNLSTHIYLSDLNYTNLPGCSSFAEHGKINKDKSLSNGVLKVNENGKEVSYARGMSMQAQAQLVYDISAYSNTYTHFVSKVGIDPSQKEHGKFWVQFFVSNDGKTWTSLHKTNNIVVKSNAVDINIEIAGYKYLRIYVDPVDTKLGSWVIPEREGDYCVLAGAKLINAEYKPSDEVYEGIHELSYYDEILSAKDAEYNYENNHRLILERELINKLGYWELEAIYQRDRKNFSALEWILSDDYLLEQVVEVGEITNADKFLSVLINLKDEYAEDLNSTKKDVYKRMMVGLAAAYSTDYISSPLSFGFLAPSYDYIERYRLYKKMYDEDLLLYGEYFEDYHVEFFRMLMQDAIRNDETLWLNAYVRDVKKYATGVYSYVNHVGSVNLNVPAYHDMANKEKYDTKYNLSQYGVPYGDGPIRYWMVMEKGGICWNQARTIQSVFRSMGRPSTGVYQPDHEAAFFYSVQNGVGRWDIAGNISGWGYSSTSWYGGKKYRTLFNWGGKSFANHQAGSGFAGNNSGYIYLAQANLNRLEDYKKSYYLNLIANSYADQNTKVEIYQKSLEVCEINLDTYDYLIKTYKTLSKSEEDWYELAKKIIDEYTYYPMAMNDLLKLIKPNLNAAQRIDIDQKEYEGLTLASNATKDKIWQDSASRDIARVLLRKTKADLASFSFDGENAGKIVLDSAYDSYTDLSWYYSLDGGKTTTYDRVTTAHSVQLTDEEIASINAENDIRIYVQGMVTGMSGHEKEYAYTIDILEGSISPNLYINDLENRVVGVDLTYEWSSNENGPWTSYADASPDNTGNKTLYVRQRATQNRLTSPVLTATFTEDNQDETRKYIPVSHLSIAEVSSQATNNQGSATYAIDGNYNTRWHSAWNGSDSQRYITIKLDRPVVLSAVEFVPAGGGNGKMIDGTIYGSMDGTNWTELAKRTNLTYTNQANTIAEAIANIKSFEITTQDEVQYVKIVADRASNGNWFTARAFNLYHNMTTITRPTASVGFDTTEPTNGNVVARLINPSVPITITSEGGDTHTFTENGEFVFTFVGPLGTEGRAVAKVDWIDKTAPTGTIKYSTTSKTNGVVFATLETDEEVTVTNNSNKFKVNEDGQIVDNEGNVYEDYTIDENGVVKDEHGTIVGKGNEFIHEFISNGEYTFEFVDKAGNTATATAKVDWIDQDIPSATLHYDITEKTNQDVTVTLEFNKENVKVLNNDGKTSYTFTKNGEFTFVFADEAGNQNKAVASVDWIDKELPTATIEYSTQEKTKDPVVATLVNPSKEITIVNNNGSNTYTFTKNGTFQFVIEDEVGNRNEIVAEVTWIEEEAPVDPPDDEKNDEITSSDYEIEDNIIRKLPLNLNVNEFMKHIQAKDEVIIKDKNQNVIEGTAKIGTGMKAYVGESVYTFVVKADIDGNGTVNLTDLAKMCLHYIEKETLVDEYLEAADIDENNKITITDLAKMQLLLIQNN